MYSQGQRVAKTLDGSRPGYRGDDAARSSEGTSGGRADPGNSPQGDGPERGGNDGNNRPDRTNPNNPPRSYSPPATPIQVVDTTSKKLRDAPSTAMTIDPLDIKEQYKIGTKINPPNAFTSMPSVSFDKPYMTKGLETIRKDNYIDNLNLRSATYNPLKIPSFIPGSTLINTIGNTIGKFGYDTNRKFFSDNSIGGKINPATNEPFGYGIDGYKAYMEQRSLGNVGAYGGTELSQNALNGRSGGDDGIMSVYNNPNDTNDGGDVDGDGDVDQTDNFIFRYFDKTGKTLQAGAGGVEDLMAQIRKRLSNIFTT